MDYARDTATCFGPWNPGVVSPVPKELRHLLTIFRSENVFTSMRDADELHDVTGLAQAEIVAFRPERLALHELLVRVTADVSVPDGPRIEDLGINFRDITRTVMTRYVVPRMPDIMQAYEALRRRIGAQVAGAVTDYVKSPAPQLAARGEKRAWLPFLERRPAPPSAIDLADPGERDAHVVAAWDAQAHAAADAVGRAALRALARVGAALMVRHGRLWGDATLVARLATDLACNDAGSQLVGSMIAPLLDQASRELGYARLQAQARPLIMNTKGPSASGKSTIRPLQRTLAAHLGVSWNTFALISPDIWRKQLLDYASLGDAYKYGGTFTGDELHIVDRKLDDYIAGKAQRYDVPHLLIDRFRFDSFAPDSDKAGSNLLTRFGQVVYLFFMVTPPASLVERAWNRGLEVGRYKAVDDVLAHAIEAYAGMPELFFTWAQRADKRVHFEFLDNSVAQGERPRTVAFGWNDALNVLDVAGLLAVERFRRIDIDATAPELLYPDPAALDASRNAGFLRQCVERLTEVNFADAATARIYLRVEHGVAVWADPEALTTALADPDTRDALDATVPGARAAPRPGPPRHLVTAERIHTLGRWGPAPPA